MTATDHPSGYSRPWVVAPGQAVALHADLPARTSVDVVRILCANTERHADGRAWGPPERIEAVARLDVLGPGRQALRPGTHVWAASKQLPPWNELALVAALQRQPHGRGGAVLCLQGQTDLTLDLHIGAHDAAQLEIAGSWIEARTTLPLPGQDWLVLVIDARDGALRIRHAVCRASVPGGTTATWHARRAALARGDADRPHRITLGRRDDRRGAADVRVDLVSVLPRALIDNLDPGALLASAPHPSAWELASQGRGCLLRARSGVGRSTADIAGDATIHETQRPTTAVRGVRWNGDGFDPRQVPAHYSALQLHGDTLLDAHWTPNLSWTAPAEVPSGAYAFRLQLGDEPPVYASFFVSAATRPRERLALWLPTFSYLAYGNAVESMRGPVVTKASHVAEHRLDALHPAHGRSLYERHADGQGVVWTGSRRPLWSVSPGHRPWQFVADSWLIDWLERRGLPFDVITDHDVHRLGERALAPYAAVLSGHHPEYVSTAMWDGLWRYLHAGGRLLYLGGNGYYWRTAVDDVDDLIEVRRAEDGTRPFIGAPAESHCAFTGEYGGLWRRLGRPPQQIVGVGMAAQGFERSAPYRKQVDAVASETAFVFDGVTGDVFGAQGCWGNGASGWEIDRADTDLGTPTGTWWLARSEGHARSMLRTKEELLSFVEPFRDAKARSDVVLAPIGRGDVFAVGSMTWVGGLWNPDGEPTDVATITANVIRRFLDPTPLPRRAPPAP
jgi:N,N-dimethylformamidase